MLVNGVVTDALSAADRGLLYGDGVFRTMRHSDGRLLHWPRHYRKLQEDCAALLLPCPDANSLLDEVLQLIHGKTDGVIKVIVTRGQGARGYAPPAQATVSRILSYSPLPSHHQHYATQGVRLHLCNLRLAHQPRLAGVKHLNRLENVLAAAEWNDADIAEGLLLDAESNVIEGTRSNLFMVQDGKLVTPDLFRCGVAGVQRERVMEWADVQGIPCLVGCFSLETLLQAEEVFLVNSIIGLWPVRELGHKRWKEFPLASRIREFLNDNTQT